MQKRGCFSNLLAPGISKIYAVPPRFFMSCNLGTCLCPQLCREDSICHAASQKQMRRRRFLQGSLNRLWYLTLHREQPSSQAELCTKQSFGITAALLLCDPSISWHSPAISLSVQCLIYRIVSFITIAGVL